MLHAYCDGSITGSHWAAKGQQDTPAHGWSGWVIKDEDGQVVTYGSLALGTDETMSANVAEYGAVRCALRWLITRHYRDEPVLVHSDSQLVMFQLSGKYQANVERLRNFRDHIRQLERLFPKGVTYQWNPRDELDGNRQADFLSKCLQEKYGAEIPNWDEVLRRAG